MEVVKENVYFLLHTKDRSGGVLFIHIWVCIRAGVCNVWQDDNGATMQYFAIYCDTVSTSCCLF